MDEVSVNVTLVEGIGGKVSATLGQTEAGSEEWPVPFLSPVPFPVQSRLLITFYSNGQTVGSAVITDYEAPVSSWVPISADEKETSLGNGPVQDVESPKAFVTLTIQEVVELTSAEQSLLHMFQPSDSSFLSSTSFQPPADELTARFALRKNVEALQGKLERDRSKYREKTKTMQLKLISARSAYEKDLWKFKLERNHLERCFRMETNELKLALEKAHIIKKQDCLMLEELQAKLQSKEKALEQETKLFTTLNKKYDDLSLAYQQSLQENKTAHQALLGQFEEQAKSLDGLQEMLAGSETRVQSLEVANFQLAQEVQRLRSILPEPCTHLIDLDRLQTLLSDSETKCVSLHQLFKDADSQWELSVLSWKQQVENDLEQERREDIRVIEDLRNQLNQAKRLEIEGKVKEADLRSQLASSKYTEIVQKDLNSEVEELNEIIEELTIENGELNERLERSEINLRTGKETEENVRRKLEETYELLEMERAAREATTLKGEECQKSLETLNSGLTAELKTVQSRLESQIASDQQELSSIRSALVLKDDTIRQLRETQETYASETSQKQVELQSSLSSLQSQNSVLNQRLRIALEDVETGKSTHAKADLKNEEKMIGLKRQMLDIEQARLNAETHSKQLEQETQELVEKFRNEKEGLEGDMELLQSSIQALTDQNQVLQRQLVALTSEKEDLERQLADTVSRIPAPRSDHKDMIDQLLREYMASHKLRNPFIRIAEGLYTFGTKKVSVTVKNGTLIIRVGGGYMFLEEFLRIYLPAETGKITGKDTSDPDFPATPRKVKLVLSPRQFSSPRSQSVGIEQKQTFTLVCEGRDDPISGSGSEFATPQMSIDYRSEAPLKTQRSVRATSPSSSLFRPTVSSQNKAVTSPVASKGSLFHAFAAGKKTYS